MTEDPQQTGFERLAAAGREDARMRRTGSYTDEEAARLIQELGDYRVREGSRGRALTLQGAAARIGISGSTLSELLKGGYRGDRDAQLRKIDQLLADDRAREGRKGEPDFTSIRITREIHGVLKFGVVHRTMPVIIGESGSGKTVHARAFVATREGAYLIRADQAFRDAAGVTALLCQAIPALKRKAELSFPKRLEALREFLQANLNTAIVVDEAQKLTKTGLETLRDLHDTSDPSGARCVSIAFFGDARFLRLISAGRRGVEGGPVEAQLSSRMGPIYCIETQAGVDGDVYTVDDIVRILRSDRLRVITPDGARWLTRLANVAGFGRLRLALLVFATARELAGGEQVVGVPELVKSLGMVHVSEAVRIEIDQAAGGELIRRTA